MLSPLWFLHLLVWLVQMVRPAPPAPPPVVLVPVSVASRPVDALVLLEANRYLAARGVRLTVTRRAASIEDTGPEGLMSAPDRVGFALVGREDDTALLGPVIADFRWPDVAGRSIAALGGTSGRILRFLLGQQGIRPRILPQVAPAPGADGADLIQLPLDEAYGDPGPMARRWVELGPEAGPYLAGILSAPRSLLARDPGLFVTITRGVARAEARLAAPQPAVPPGFAPRLSPAARRALVRDMIHRGLVPLTPQFPRMERIRTATLLGLDPQHLLSRLDGAIALEALVSRPR